MKFPQPPRKHRNSTRLFSLSAIAPSGTDMPVPVKIRTPEAGVSFKDFVAHLVSCNCCHHAWWADYATVFAKDKLCRRLSDFAGRVAMVRSSASFVGHVGVAERHTHLAHGYQDNLLRGYAAVDFCSRKSSCPCDLCKERSEAFLRRQSGSKKVDDTLSLAGTSGVRDDRCKVETIRRTSETD